MKNSKLFYSFICLFVLIILFFILNVESIDKKLVPYCINKDVLNYSPSILLFNGKNLDGWTSTYNGTTPPNKGWVVEDGAIYRRSSASDLYTIERFSDFILEFEYKLNIDSNSGVKYRVWNPSLGYEYQLIGSKHPDSRMKNRITGSLYDMIAPSNETIFKDNEYNTGVVFAYKNKIIHKINGVEVVNIDIGSKKWIDSYNNSKFKNMKEYGTSFSGPILLQDHGDPVWYKNIRIKQITTEKRCIWNILNI